MAIGPTNRDCSWVSNMWTPSRSKNLDLQLETNIVRPFVYQHSDTVANYSNYNQPMAHPLGANFSEVIGIIRYQPRPTNGMWRRRPSITNRDWTRPASISAATSFENYLTRPRDYGFKIGGGVPANCINVSGLVSWQWKENLFLDLSMQYRNYSVNDPSHVYHSSSSALFTAGVRINMFRRTYDY